MPETRLAAGLRADALGAVAGLMRSPRLPSCNEGPSYKWSRKGKGEGPGSMQDGRDGGETGGTGSGNEFCVPRRPAK